MEVWFRCLLQPDCRNILQTAPRQACKQHWDREKGSLSLSQLVILWHSRHDRRRALPGKHISDVRWFSSEPLGCRAVQSPQSGNRLVLFARRQEDVAVISPAHLANRWIQFFITRKPLTTPLPPVHCCATQQYAIFHNMTRNVHSGA